MSHEDREPRRSPRSQDSQPAQAAEAPAVAPGKRPRTLNLPQAPANTRPSIQRMPDPAAEAARREQTTRTA